MKLLIDADNVIWTSFHINLKQIDKDDPNFVVHIFLLSILNLKKRFNVSSKDMIICFGEKQTWRKKAFQYYKASRKVQRDKSEIDFQMLYDLIEKLYNDLLKFPFVCMRNKWMEADDWIAILSKYYSQNKEEHVIVSTDRDFYQLQVSEYARQFNFLKNHFMPVNNASLELKLKILCGDPGDGIPNILSDSDTFVNELKRQKNMGVKKASKLILDYPDLENYFKVKNLEKNYRRNKILIDFEEIPKIIQEKALEKFLKYKVKNDRMVIESILHRRKLNLLMCRINEFL